MNYKIKKMDIFLLIFLAIIIAATILCIINPTFGEYFSVANWFGSETLSKINVWTAIGFTMLVCFLGALIPIPVPYTIPVTLFAGAWYRDMGISAFGLIILLVVAAAIANTIGDMVDYMVGKGAKHLMDKDDPEIQDRWSQIILSKPKAIPYIIVIFGLTPLPDSLLMVPLGIAEYNIKKTFLWMLFSRILMMSFYAIIGIFAIEWLTGMGDDPFGWILGIIFLYILWLIIAIMVKYKPKPKPKKPTEESD